MFFPFFRKAVVMKISQAMIVKNEEKNIERALSWGKGIVSEQIVIDTGSTDRTVEIAKSMGAKVISFPWQDDFALARNFAIENCQYPWIVMLDADEYFSKEDAEKLKACISLVDKNKQILGLSTLCANLNKEGQIGSVGSLVRIFRNRKDIRYHGAIHEHLERADGKDFVVKDFGNALSVLHTGYMDLENAEKVKTNRNMKIIQKELEKNPNDIAMRIYLGKEYFLQGKWKESVEQYRRFIKLIPEKYEMLKPFISYGLANYLSALEAFLSEEEKAGRDTKKISAEEKEVVELGRKLIPDGGDYLFTYGKILYQKEKYEEAIPYLQEALEKVEKFGATAKSERLLGEILNCYKMLGNSFYKLGKLSEAVHYSTVIIRENPADMDALKFLLRVFGEGKTAWADVKVFLQKFYGENMEKVEKLAKYIGY